MDDAEGPSTRPSFRMALLLDVVKTEADAWKTLRGFPPYEIPNRANLFSKRRERSLGKAKPCEKAELAGASEHFE
ncbi:MAG TPA: hypothetical protein DEQ55_00075 [Pseudomonas sp.]|nr:hypothetical protein [Pseudomonas sp.]